MQFKTKIASSFAVISLVLPTLPTLPNADSFRQEVFGSAERKIVVFQDGITDTERDAVLAGVRANRVKRLRAALTADVLDGLGAADVAALSANPKVKRIDNDAIAYALPHNTVTIQAQSLPWGIDRINAELVWPSGNAANPIKVGVIDTGISLSHSDLTSNIKGGVNTIYPWRNANDDNGHGSHVAGIIAALSNSQGVVGAAHQADLYAIKVLSASGSGYISDIIEGIDWAITRDLDVINMSLGTTVDIQSLHDAVIRAKNAGIVVVTAAGNNGGAVIYPAAYSEAIAVSAIDSTHTIASWSSRGPEVDLAAPGVSIYSTYKGKNYATLSGTSMASPHVAGAVALLLNTAVGVNDANGNGRWDPDEIETRLEATASDLGATGFDNLYGAGLVNAFQAVQ